MSKNITKLNNNETKLSPPWWEFYNKLNAMFGNDPEIHMDFNEEQYTIKMFVDNQAKADALAQVLPMEKEYGKITLKIEIIPSDKANGFEQLYKTIFNGNPVFSEAVDIDQEGIPHVSYVIFKPLIAQFFNDNLADAFGNYTALYQDVAKELFVPQNGVYFCTENLRPKNEQQQ